MAEPKYSWKYWNTHLLALGFTEYDGFKMWSSYKYGEYCFLVYKKSNMKKYLYFEILFQRERLFEGMWHIDDYRYCDIMLSLAGAIVDPSKAVLLVNHPADRVITTLLERL